LRHQSHLQKLRAGRTSGGSPCVSGFHSPLLTCRELAKSRCCGVPPSALVAAVTTIPLGACSGLVLLLPLAAVVMAGPPVLRVAIFSRPCPTARVETEQCPPRPSARRADRPSHRGA